MGYSCQKTIYFGSVFLLLSLMVACNSSKSQRADTPTQRTTSSSKDESQITNTPIATATISTSVIPTILPTNTRSVITISAEILATTLVPSVTPQPTNTSIPTKISTQIAKFNSVKNAECIPITTKREIGIVKSITDGDTIVVTIEGIDYKVRYIGVDSPEPSEGSIGIEASNTNKNLVLRKEVVLIKDESEVDRYNRLLRYVVVGNVFVNERLVSLGVAKAVSYEPDTTCQSTFVKAQSTAVGNNLGLWAPAIPAIGFGIVSPQATVGSPCNCSIDYDCGDFSTHAAAQSCFSACGGSSSYNWSNLDRDHDNSACETLPR